MANKYTDMTGLLYVITKIKALLAKKVDTVDGKGLSTNDYDATEKGKVSTAHTHSQTSHAPSGAQVNLIESIKLNGVALTIASKVVDIALSKSSVGLGNVDNTSDADKPVSTATKTALDLKASLNSPALTGTPTVPTASVGTNTTQAASTAFVSTAISNAVAGVYKIKGSILFSALPTTGMVAGDVYNVTDSFTTTASFMEGAGKTYPAGTNIVYNSSSKWDCLAGIYDFSGYMLSSDMVAVTTAEIDAMFT